MTVAGIGSVVVAQLRAAGYAESTVVLYERVIGVLARYAAGRDAGYSPELGAQFASGTVSPRTGRFSAQRRATYRRIVDLFDSYVHTGIVDLSVRGRGGGGPRPAQPAMAALAAAWESDMTGRGLAGETRGSYGRMARGYLVFLEQRGVSDLAGADGGSVLAFLASLRGRWANSSMARAASYFRPFLKFTGRPDLVAAVNLARYRRSRPVIEVLGGAEQGMVVAACTSGQVSERNAAITLLALVTGLRACDIIGLRLADVDWRGATISIVQQKTGNPLTLPLPPLVLGKLADYVLRERPATADEHVFVRVPAPHTRLAGHASVHTVITRTFRAAGMADASAGTRFLRHSTATGLLRAGVPLPTISAVLGHASEDSSGDYMSTDRERMLQCVLPVPAGALR
ncbi:MAG TPA: tyrosine-type recombinase/integrase [Streptosporangiaceae bacterium]|nr:tyrosine-type recombinase/integrase [Streptosporangiaceae bacterium]